MDQEQLAGEVPNGPLETGRVKLPVDCLQPQSRERTRYDTTRPITARFTQPTALAGLNRPDVLLVGAGLGWGVIYPPIIKKYTFPDADSLQRSFSTFLRPCRVSVQEDFCKKKRILGAKSLQEL